MEPKLTQMASGYGYSAVKQIQGKTFRIQIFILWKNVEESFWYGKLHFRLRKNQ